MNLSDRQFEKLVLLTNWKAFGAIAICLLVIVATVFAITVSMDDFNGYHPIACYYFPNAHFHSLREPCNGLMDLYWNGHKVWSRAYVYGGVGEALAYFPFYLLLPYSFSHGLYGGCMLILGIFCFARLLQAPFLYTIIGVASNYFLVFQLMRNAGGLSNIQGMALFAIPLLVRMIWRVDTTRKYALYTMLLVVTAFFAVEVKMSFFYAIPGLILVTLTQLPFEKTTRWKRVIFPLLQLLPAVILVFLLLGLLVSLQTLHDGRYYDVLRYWSGSDGPPQSFIDYITRLGNLGGFLYNFVSATNFVHPRNDMQGGTLLIAIILTCIWWCSLGYLAYWHQRHLIGKNHNNSERAFDAQSYFGCACLIAAVLTYGLVGMNRYAQNPHHMNFVHQFLTMAFCYYLFSWLKGRSRKMLHLMLLASVLLSASVGVVAWSREGWNLIEYSPNREELLHAIRYDLPHDAYVVYGTWGMYYLGSLYTNPDQLAVYSDPLDLENIANIMEKSHHSTVYFVIGNQKPTDPLGQFLYGLGKKLYPLPSQNWDWDIWYMDGNVLSTYLNCKKNNPNADACIKQ